MSSKRNFDVNVDGRTNERTDGRTEIWTPISHPAISRCDKNSLLLLVAFLNIFMRLHVGIKLSSCRELFVTALHLTDLRQGSFMKFHVRVQVINGCELLRA